MSLHTFALASGCPVAGTTGWHWLILVFVLTNAVSSCCDTLLQSDQSCDSMHMYSHTLGIVDDDPLCAMLLHSLNRFLAQLLRLFSLAELSAGLPFPLILAELCLSSASLLLLSSYVHLAMVLSSVRLFSFNKSSIVSISSALQ